MVGRGWFFLDLGLRHGGRADVDSEGASTQHLTGPKGQLFRRRCAEGCLLLQVFAASNTSGGASEAVAHPGAKSPNTPAISVANAKTFTLTGVPALTQRKREL